jgi:hypothetical protein
MGNVHSDATLPQVFAQHSDCGACKIGGKTHWPPRVSIVES